MNDDIYMVTNNNITTSVNEAEALKIIQDVANDIYSFSLVSPSDASKLELIARLDNLQNDINIKVGASNIRIHTKDNSLVLIIKDKRLAFIAKCSITSKDIQIV